MPVLNGIYFTARHWPGGRTFHTWRAHPAPSGSRVELNTFPGLEAEETEIVLGKKKSYLSSYPGNLDLQLAGNVNFLHVSISSLMDDAVSR